MKRICLYFTLILAFLLGVKDGFVALWKVPEENPAWVFPWRADALPDEDRKALEKGIYIEDGEALHGLLEDYLS